MVNPYANTIPLTDLLNIPSHEESTMSSEEALVKLLNKTGMVNMRELEKMTGKTWADIVDDLNGAIYQNPEPFKDGTIPYTPYEYWMVSSVYLSGNVREKLFLATILNKRFNGVFQKNIEALKGKIPPDVPIDEISFTVWPSWLPVEDFEDFLVDVFHLTQKPQVIFNESLLTYKNIVPKKAKTSMQNTVTYGVRTKNSDGSYTQELYGTDVCEMMANGKVVKVYDYTYDRNTDTFEQHENPEKTIMAQQAEKAINKELFDWIMKSPSRKAQYEGYYNASLVNYNSQPYDGSFLTLPGLNPAVKLYNHQRNAVARILLSNYNTLLSHDVGSGKTYIMLIAAHELRRMEKAKKIIIAVPNAVLKETVKMYQYLYPEDNDYIAISPSSFIPARRNKVLQDIADADSALVFIAYSCFDMIRMSKSHYENKMGNEIQKLKQEASKAPTPWEQKALENKAKKLSKKLYTFSQTESDPPWLSFEQLHIDTIFLDEAHNYKNIGTFSRSDNIIGLSSKGSKKCVDMYEKAQNVKRLIMATGTALVNSITDLYTLQRYLQPKVLEANNLGSFDLWINVFGQREICVECDVDSNANSLRIMTRFTKFHNLSELMNMFSLVADFHHIEKSEEERDLPKYGGPINVTVSPSPIQKAYIKNLSTRTDAIRAKQVPRTEDNLLKVTIDGRKIAIHEGLANLSYSDLLELGLTPQQILTDEKSPSKLDVCADKIMELHQQHPDCAQIVFSDIGTPKNKFNVYDELRAILVKRGMSQHEIAFVHEATTEKERSKLFADINKGLLKVVIGSTQKLGVGVNVQEKLIALHHIDVPWRPADMTQREGRILRRGNTCDVVYIYRYITEESFDAYSWQLLESKQKFISSFLSGVSSEREASDLSDLVLSYAEVKALAIGNPLIKTRVEVANRLEHVRIAFRNRQKQLFEYRSIAQSAPDKIKEYERLAEIAAKDEEYYSRHRESIPNDDRISFGEELLEALGENNRMPYERHFDDYQGFSVYLPANMQEHESYISLHSENGGKYLVNIPADKTPLGCTKSIDWVLDHLDEKKNSHILKAKNTKEQLRESTVALNEGNPYEKQIDDLVERLNAIDTQLEQNAKMEDNDDEFPF